MNGQIHVRHVLERLKRELCTLYELVSLYKGHEVNPCCSNNPFVCVCVTLSSIPVRINALAAVARESQYKCCLNDWVLKRRRSKHALC